MSGIGNRWQNITQPPVGYLQQIPAKTDTENLRPLIGSTSRYTFFAMFFSGYCMTEFRMAYHHNVVVKRKKRLIVLMALDSLDELNTHNNDDDAVSDTTMLRQFVRQYTYIDYRRQDWLDRLLYALPLRGLLQRNDHQIMEELNVPDDVPLYRDIL